MINFCNFKRWKNWNLNIKPVMLSECIDGLNIKPDGIYVDGTLRVELDIVKK